MAVYLGIDTSNYTTSVALYDNKKNKIVQCKKLLPVKDGALGLRQSDAVFAHLKQLSSIIEELMLNAEKPSGIGVSVRPRDIDGSYMPCFLAGECSARVLASTMQIPLTQVSHQAGHIVAALYSADQLQLMERKFAAFHLSGGTTECLLVKPGNNKRLEIEIFAQSLDLKAGQAIDRVGAMLGLPFPAGRDLEKLALQSDKSYKIKPTFHGRDCCLSGIENKCEAMLKKHEPYVDIARFCLDNILAVLLQMTNNVRMDIGTIPIIYAGGVMSNSILQKELAGNGFFAEPAFSSDNAAGVAILAHRTQEDIW